MAKGPIITKEVKKAISEVYFSNRELKARAIQSEVSKRFNNGDNWPSLSVVEKLLVGIRKKNNESRVPGGLDTPWYLGLLEPQLTPEAIAKIIELNKNGAGITIRQAKWLNKLSALPVSLDFLHCLVMLYAIHERNNEFYGDDFAFNEKVDEEYVIELLRQYGESALNYKSPTDDETKAKHPDFFGKSKKDGE